jgi:hypothetical protein
VPWAGTSAIDAFLDLSHGATMDAEAAALWSQLYDASLVIDGAGLRQLRDRADTLRRGWREAATHDPAALGRALGPVVVLQVAGRKVGLAAFGELQPLLFDVNAAGPPMLRVAGLAEVDIMELLAERAQKPFADAADFFQRTSKLEGTKVLISPE